MYEGYPTHSYFGYLERDIKFQLGIDNLEEDGIIRKGGKSPDGRQMYRLTGEGLKLVEQWHAEKINKATMILSFIILYLTVNQIILAILQLS